MLPNLPYKFNAILIKTPTGFFLAHDKQILKFTEKSKGPKDPEEEPGSRFALSGTKNYKL